MFRLTALSAALAAFCLAGCGSQRNAEALPQPGAAAQLSLSPRVTQGVAPYLWTGSSYVESLRPLPKENTPTLETGCILHPAKCPGFDDQTTRAVAINNEGSVFIAMSNGVAAFKLTPGRENSPLEFTFHSNVSVPDALAFDHAGNLFVASVGVNNVDIFLRVHFGMNTPLSHYIHHGINHPVALVVDRHDNLFVANYASDSVTEYLPTNRTEYHAAITHGINKPTTLATDSRGYLYVGNSGSNTVTAYAPGTTSPAYTIQEGINGPSALAVDKNDDLYVSNFAGNSVTVYAPGATTPKRTLTQDIHQPVGLAVDDALNVYVTDTNFLIVYQGPAQTYYSRVKADCCGHYKGVIVGPRFF